jgi:hypothetical protein
MPSVNDRYHESLMDDVKQCLKEAGYAWYEADYGTVAGDACKEVLRNRTSPSAVFLRTRADRIACRHDIEFEFDAKTKQNRYSDIAVEALPLVHHALVNSHFDLPCLYAFRWIQLDNCPDVGFWIDHDFCNLVSSLWIFTWRDDMSCVNNWLKKTQPLFFPNATIIVECKDCRGSGDPMAIVDSDAAHALPHWRTLIP